MKYEEGDYKPQPDSFHDPVGEVVRMLRQQTNLAVFQFLLTLAIFISILAVLWRVW